VTSKFEKGDWIVNQDGICQVYGSEDYYVEDFFKHEQENLEVGDLFDKKVVYKIFAGLDGVPRKTRFFSHLSGRYCEALDEESQKILDGCKSENSELYEKFLKRKPSKPITSCVEFSVRFDPDVRDDAINSINELFQNIEKPFSYDQFDSLIKEELKVKFPENLYSQRDTMMSNVLVSLFYSVLEPRHRKISFTDGVAVKTYCSYDEGK